MVRTQIQLTEEQQTALRELAAATGRSVAELVRDAIERTLSAHSRPTRHEMVRRAAGVAGRFSSGSPDGSSDHDHHLAEAYR